MKNEEEINHRPITYIANLSRTPIFEAEPSIKNAHTATHLRVLDNQLVFICIEQVINIYSLSKIAKGRAPLINVISLGELFAPYQKEFYEDLVTGIFRKAEKEDFSSQIFSEQQDLKSNILLNVNNVRNRINFFNNSKIKVKSFDFNQAGNCLIVLFDGRGTILKHKANNWKGSDIQSIRLNDIIKEKIEHGCFVLRDLACLIIQNKAIGFDISEGGKTFTHKLTVKNINQINGYGIDKDKVRLIAISGSEANVFEITKKKIVLVSTVKFNQFINQSFFYDSFFYVVTQTTIFKVDNISLSKNIVHQLTQPCELTNIDEFGNFNKKSLKTSTECLWLADSTSNGVYIGLTIRRNGNYKEGRLLVFQCCLNYYIERLISNIKINKGYLNILDSIFINKSKENKEILQEFIALGKKDAYEFNGIPLTLEQYNVASINLGHAFQGKQIAKQKIIEKTLNSWFEKVSVAKKKLDYVQLVNLCCFTGAVIEDEDVNYCQDCDLFGIRSKGDKCVVCLKKMIPYE